MCKKNIQLGNFFKFYQLKIERISEKLSKNENKNVLFESKHTKFWINKFLNNNEENNKHLFKKDFEPSAKINIKKAYYKSKMASSKG